jgi:hypothetical protein
MKRNIFILIFLVASIAVNAQIVLLQETFQDWTAQDTAISYSISKKLFDGNTEGTFTSDALVVSPNKAIGEGGVADGNSNPSKGRIVIRGKESYLQLPELSSIGQVNIKASAGTDLKEFKLQVLKNGVFIDITGTESSCMKTVTKLFTFNFSYSSPATLRIVPTSNGKIFIWDVFQQKQELFGTDRPIAIFLYGGVPRQTVQPADQL